jgi:UDP-glucuronate decarboxylase
MNFFKNKLSKNLKLLDILKNVDLKKISKKEEKFFKNKRILITGASGVIGINLLFFFNALVIKKKIPIIVDGTYNTSLFSFVKKFFFKNRFISFKKIDLTQKKLDKKKYDLIFHCAGYGQPAKFLKFSSSTYKLNSLTIMNLRKNLKKGGKFIYMSTTEIYSGNNDLCDENSIGNTTPNHPRSPYIESKRFGESYLINSGDNFLIYRVCLTYGVGAKLNDERILNLLLLRSIKEKRIDIYGGLNQLRSNLYINDAINMIVKSSVKFNKEIFNVSNHKMTTIGQMVKIISKISNKKIKKHKSFLKGSPNIIKISNKKILKSINYKITTNLKDGLQKTFDWYLNLIN